MSLRALIKRIIGTADLDDDAVTGAKLGPDSVNEVDHDHIDPDWEQTGRVSAIAVDAVGGGWQQRPVTFPAAFPQKPNFLLHSVCKSSPGQPSGLKVFIEPSGITATGFNMNIDVNASCTISGATIDVCWLARRILKTEL